MRRNLLLLALCLVHVHAWSPSPSSFGQLVSPIGRQGGKSTTRLQGYSKASDMVDFIEKPMDTLVGDEPPKVPPEKDNLASLVRCVVQAADQRKADDIVVFRTSSVSTMTSFVVIVSGNSRPQNQAIAGSIKDDVQESFGLLPGATGVPEGDARSEWMVLDYQSVMAHVMTPKSRLHYNLEKYWEDKGAEHMDISDLVLPNTVPSPTSDTTPQDLPDEDPFWS